MSHWTVVSLSGGHYGYDISWKGIKLTTKGFTIPLLAIMLGDSKGLASLFISPKGYVSAGATFQRPPVRLLIETLRPDGEKAEWFYVE